MHDSVRRLQEHYQINSGTSSNYSSFGQVASGDAVLILNPLSAESDYNEDSTAINNESRAFDYRGLPGEEETGNVRDRFQRVFENLKIGFKKA